MAFIAALLLAYEPAKRLARVRISLESGIVGVRMMFQLADEPLTLAGKPDAKPLLAGPGEIRFDTVSFAYQNGPPVLDRFDLTALVGPSGRIDDLEPDHAHVRLAGRQADVRRPADEGLRDGFRRE